MALYPVVHKETGEEQLLEMSILDWDQWKEDNPDWKRDWSKGCAGVGEVGEWKDKMLKKNPGWKQVLDKVKRSPGSRAQNLY